MALRSRLFRGDPRLEAAAETDSAHILPGARGPHVTKIQKALNQVAGATLETDGVYGTATAAAVAEFKRKQRPQILNFAGAIDNIVGIKTIAALDDMLPRAGGLQLNFDVNVTLVDIVVNFFGAAGEGPRDPEDALPRAMLNASHDRVDDPLNRGLLRHKANGNLLLRIAQGTTKFGPLGAPNLATVLKSIQIMLQGTDPSNGNTLLAGKIFVFGTSSGGRNAIEFGGILATAGLLPHFMASIDASFTQADTDDRPGDNPQRALPIPKFKLSRIVGPFAALILRIPNRHNLFQTKGNRRGESFNPFASPFFTSNMSGGLGEIHGRVEGFKDDEILVTGLFGNTDDNFHEECDSQGRRKVQLLIAEKLIGRNPLPLEPVFL